MLPHIYWISLFVSRHNCILNPRLLTIFDCGCSLCYCLKISDWSANSMHCPAEAGVGCRRIVGIWLQKPLTELLFRRRFCTHCWWSGFGSYSNRETQIKSINYFFFRIGNRQMFSCFIRAQVSSAYARPNTPRLSGNTASTHSLISFSTITRLVSHITYAELHHVYAWQGEGLVVEALRFRYYRWTG